MAQTLLPALKSIPSKALKTVRKHVGVVAASSKERFGGIGTINCAGTMTVSPKQPGAKPNALSPTNLPTTPAIPNT